MKIEKFKISCAVADGVKRGLLAQKVRETLNGICYGVEVEDAAPPPPPSEAPEAAPRKKRKYMRHAEVVPSESAIETHGHKIQRRKLADGTTIELRGNCQGGGAV